MRTRTALPLLALAIALSGCSDDGSGTPDAPSTGAAPTSQPVAGSYGSPAEVIAAMEANGLSCEEPETGQFPGTDAATRCIFDGSEDVVVVRFATPEQREQFIAAKDELESLVVGDDWAVVTVLEPTAQRIAGAIGGEVVAGAPAG